MPRASAARRPCRAHTNRRRGDVAAGARLPCGSGVTLRGRGRPVIRVAEERVSWAIVVHGGAKEIAAEQAEANRRGCLDALAAGRATLERGGSAVQAVEAAIRLLESDPTFNAGFGSDLNADGEVEMDAAVMDGTTLDIGAVAAITGVLHPVSVARQMLGKPLTLLVGNGAHRFA